MGESSDSYVAEQIADSLDAVAEKLWYGGNADLSERLRRAADVLREEPEAEDA